MAPCPHEPSHIYAPTTPVVNFRAVLADRVVDPGFEMRLRHGTNFLGNNLTALEDQQGRDAAHIILLRCQRIFIDVQFDDRKRITLGIADILAAEQIILVATGAAKAAAISAMINGPKTPDCPASLLRDHPDVRLFLDKEAASQIS